MAWIELHQTLPRHPKLLRLAGRLRIHPAQAAGHLTFLWLWTLDYAPTGDLSAFGPAEISAAACFPGDAEQFHRALMETGWLDKDGQVHDWHEYAGRLLEERVQAKERMRKYRLRERSTNDPEQNNSRNSSGSSTGQQEPKSPSNTRASRAAVSAAAESGNKHNHQNRPETEDSVTRTFGERSELPNPTQPNPTVPNHITGTKVPRFVPPSREELDLEAAKVGLPPNEVDAFVGYYGANGWKVGRNPMKSWPHALAGWAARWRERNGHLSSSGGRHGQPSTTDTRRSLVAGADEVQRNAIASAQRDREMAERGELPL